MTRLFSPTPTTVTAITPIKPGADIGLLHDALAAARTSLAEPFQWRFACAADDLEAVTAMMEDLHEAGTFLDADGFLTTSKNVAATRNRLAEMGSGDYLMQLDADDLYAPGGLAQMKWQLDRRHACVAAHGRAVDMDSTGSSVIFDPPAWWNTFTEDVARPGELAARRADIGRAWQAWMQIPGYVACYPMHPGAGLYRRTAVIDVGGWDEELGNYFEDTVLTAKLQARHSWHVTHGTIVLLYRRDQAGSLTGRAIDHEAWNTLDAIARAHEEGRGHDAPEPPFPTPGIDKTPRPVLAADELSDLVELPAGAQHFSLPGSLTELFVKPLVARDPAAKTEEEYAATEQARYGLPGVDTADYDDAPPSLVDDDLAALVADLTDPPAPQPKDD